MTRRAKDTRILLLTLVLVVGLSQAVVAGENLTQTNFGTSTFFSNPACPVRDVPALESLVPLPAILDAFADELVEIGCAIEVRGRDRGVKNAKGRYTSQVIVRDNETGMLEAFDVGTGRIKTDKDGKDEFNVTISASIFSDGFESGDVSAWSYTRADFNNRKKAESTSVQCLKTTTSTR